MYCNIIFYFLNIIYHLSYTATSLNNALTNLVKVMSLEGTTDADGDLSLSSIPSSNTIVATKTYRVNGYYASYYSLIHNLQGNVDWSSWYVKALKDDGTPLRSTKIKFDVFYI